MSFLKELGPSAIDAELRCLGPDNGGNVELLEQFLTVLNHTLRANRDIDVAQAYLGLFLKVMRIDWNVIIVSVFCAT